MKQSRSSNYYVIVARESLRQLPYSVDEIYGLKNTNRTTTKYPVYSRVYTSTYRIYGDTDFRGERPDLVIVEDTNSGYEFFQVCYAKRASIKCISAGGKSNICNCIMDAPENDILVIADGCRLWTRNCGSSCSIAPKEHQAIPTGIV